MSDKPPTPAKATKNREAPGVWVVHRKDWTGPIVLFNGKFDAYDYAMDHELRADRFPYGVEIPTVQPPADPPTHATPGVAKSSDPNP
jgi:hypothetical protein